MQPSLKREKKCHSYKAKQRTDKWRILLTDIAGIYHMYEKNIYIFSYNDQNEICSSSWTENIIPVLCARCGISKCNLNSSKIRSPGSFKFFIVIVILDEQNKKQLKKEMILNKWTLKTNILENGCYFHVWMTKNLSWELSIEYFVTTAILC